MRFFQVADQTNSIQFSFIFVNEQTILPIVFHHCLKH